MRNSNATDWLSLFQPRTTNPLDTVGQMVNIAGTLQQGDQNQQRIDADLMRMEQDNLWKERTFPLDQLLGEAQVRQVDSNVRSNDSNVMSQAAQMEDMQYKRQQEQALQPLQKGLLEAQIAEMVSSGRLHEANAAQALAYVNSLMSAAQMGDPRSEALIAEFQQSLKQVQ